VLPSKCACKVTICIFLTHLSKDYHGFFALLQSKQQLFEIAFALNWPLSYSAGGLHHQHCTLRSQFPDWECSLRYAKSSRSSKRPECEDFVRRKFHYRSQKAHCNVCAAEKILFYHEENP